MQILQNRKWRGSHGPEVPGEYDEQPDGSTQHAESALWRWWRPPTADKTSTDTGRVGVHAFHGCVTVSGSNQRMLQSSRKIPHQRLNGRISTCLLYLYNTFKFDHNVLGWSSFTLSDCESECETCLSVALDTAIEINKVWTDICHVLQCSVWTKSWGLFTPSFYVCKRVRFVHANYIF